MKTMRVCVLGAGITGLAAAYELQREGHEVTVIDRAGAGSGASGANGAQLSYAYVQPLADPSLWTQLPRPAHRPASSSSFSVALSRRTLGAQRCRGKCRSPHGP
jgi:glycine/D-amino acid oxidase-like deaminating enzyme